MPDGAGTVQGVTANFSALYAILGSTYGASGKLPDLRGEFIRGWVDNRVGIDTGTTFGRFQADEFESHRHQSNIDAADAGIAMPGPTGGTAARAVPYTRTITNVGLQGGTETRPINIALLACIKY